MTRAVACDLVKIFKSSISAVLPENLIKPSVKYDPENHQLSICGDKFNVQNKNVYLIGAGKAVQDMAIEIEGILKNKIKHGIISIPVGSTNSEKTRHTRIKYYEGANNNLPDLNAQMTAKKIIDLVTKLDSNDLLLVLISGGGSALLPLPKPPITLDEKTTLISRLANLGADIKELNTVRKQLSAVKGGGLSMKAQPAQVISLILSDIVGNPLDLIASGPTVEDEDSPIKAIGVINKYNLYNELPESIRIVLKECKNDRPFPRDNVRNYIIGSNMLSITAALREARNLGYVALSLSSVVTGDVKDIASEYVKATKLFCSFLNGSLTWQNCQIELKYLNIPGINTSVLENITMESIKNKDLCIILGGEITVEVRGSGKGGRNQHLALQISSFLDEIKNEFKTFDILFLSCGTDGIDGPTDAAGAMGYLDLISDAKKENINVQRYLDGNDSYNFFKEFKRGYLHIITGHTNTNVMDIHIIIIKRK